ncbi:rho guanine nucleotide exchange factor 10-like protein isoform X2 [Sitodiplosis mosellana]|uniref:rho guanine nucleotide exchange factor 10-like protein isoform X2 n=1 Tax=Sitodiplosis mosellana TaxID=263140 RepID=UPI00244456F6|nr:rho guanine nucleotide exchange factor 10-like protein isoform X2 [Sitodiplosis mosellana]
MPASLPPLLYEPKLNSGAWEDPLPISNAAKSNNNHLHSAGSRRSEPFPALRLSNKLNTNPLSSVAAAAAAAASLQNGNYTLNTIHQNFKNRKRLEHTPSSRTVSSDEGWCSERGGSEHDFSSDGEDEDKKSINSLTSVNTRNSHLRSTLNKAKQHLSFDKWRSGGTSSNHSNTTMPSQQPEILSPGESSPGGRLSRWFSIRRGSAHQYDFGASKNSGRDSRAGSIEPDEKSKQSGTLNGTTINGYKMPLLPETDEIDGALLGALNGRNSQSHIDAINRQLNLTLPATPPSGLSQQQLKRRHIFAAIVHSECSYVATLQRLVNDYKKPLEESNPPILNSSKIAILFHRLPEILHCHTLFRIALAECVRNWDCEEKVADAFISSFGKPIILEIYSGFINNFSAAMELAKMEAKRKSALADFFKVKQISAHDRLSFFGLMVKPVQRFPQFILFLQDLLKYTPQGHHDRMSLQLALTQLESLAEMLNERKREAEQYQAFKEMLGNIGGTFNTRSLSSEGNRNRYLLREDNVTHLEFNQAGFIVKSKQRRLLLLNDKVICVSVAPKLSNEFGATEKLSFKWMYPVNEVEIVDNSTSATLSRILTAGLNRGGSLKSNGSGANDTLSSTSSNGSPTNGADNLCSEMSTLMHDYEVMSRINDLIGSLKGNYRDINTDLTKKILATIQSSIQKKDEEMAWVDSCCLQLIVRTKNGKEETFTFQTEDPSVKKEWITELRLAQLSLDPNNSPAWEIPEREQRPPSTKLPLFVKAQSVHKSHHQTEVRCGCYYTTTNHNRTSTRRRSKNQNYAWICTTDGTSSHTTILLQHHQRAGELKEVGSFDLVETIVTSMEFVKGINNLNPEEEESDRSMIDGDSVWMGTMSKKIFIYSATNPEQDKQIAVCTLPAAVTQIVFHMDSTFVALTDGTVQIFRRGYNGHWLLKEPQTVSFGVSEPITSILSINANVYAGCGQKVYVLNGCSGEIQKAFDVNREQSNGTTHTVQYMAHSGIGLWISLKNSSVICLYHTETFKHLQDVNIASNVLRVTSSQRDCVNNNSSVFVTALMASKGLLWVGTNVGISLTIPLPRLEGVPIISGAVNISYHAHFGPVTFLMPLLPKSYYKPLPSEPPPTTTIQQQNFDEDDKLNEDSTVTLRRCENDEQNQKTNTKDSAQHKKTERSNSQDMSARLKAQLVQSPVVLRRRRGKDAGELSRASKTLPRGLGSAAAFTASMHSNTSSSQGSDHSGCDVYGLYGDLIFVKEDYDNVEQGQGTLMDPSYESLRRSEPELATIATKVTTLDRRLRIKVSRPRSLDLSNWSVDSRSSSLYTSSGSEESMAIRQGLFSSRSVSRNSSNASHKTGTDLMNICENSTDIQIVPTMASTPPSATSTMNRPILKRSPKEEHEQMQTVVAATLKKKKNAKNSAATNESVLGRRTVITLTGGRGYINWKHVWYNYPMDKSHKTNQTLARAPNSSDAHVVMWEKKL